MLFSIAVLALLASVQGRAVNISNTWVLPEEGFPVFYRYFRDRISWYEADAVCQFHHANLVTVDTTAQYDAVRAYLKELDISSAVWVGLIRSNPDGDFTWTDYRGLSGDGYWSSAPDARAAPLCAAADPAADYRWEARGCGGPTVAAFICELPVPQWALGTEGCMVRALPALTILYLPESAAVQLTADCGMADVKKVQCTGNVKREDLLKELSCANEDDLTSMANPISTGFNWPSSTASTFIDQDSTNEATTEETITTEHEVDINQTRDISATSMPRYIYPQAKYKLPIGNHFNQFNNKTVNLEESQDNSVQSNFIPKISDDSNMMTNEQLEKLEDERHIQHKMLHEEIARVGNVENIFTQPTDHFIPPLVMAKAKISDDMTVLSLAEKHAQQLAEKQFSKHNLNTGVNDNTHTNNYITPQMSFTAGIDKPIIAPMKPTKLNNGKKEILKSNSPKKYVNEKHYDVKNKIFKSNEGKVTEEMNPTVIITTTESTTKKMEITTGKNNLEVTNKSNMGDDLGMDLTVFLNDAPLTSEEQTSFSGDIVKLETIQNTAILNSSEPVIVNVNATLNQSVEFIINPEPDIKIENITVTHEATNITSNINYDTKVQNTTIFEVTTKIPVFLDNIMNDLTTTTLATISQEIRTTENYFTTNNKNTYETTAKIGASDLTTVPVKILTSTMSISLVTGDNVTATHPDINSTETTTSTEIISMTESQNSRNDTKDVHDVVETVVKTTSLPVTTTIGLDNNTNINASSTSNESIEKTDEINNAEYHEMLTNVTNHQQGEEEDSDFQSPLLSGVMEPMHRPPRTRRPQQPNRNKFNPFRILG